MNELDIINSLVPLLPQHPDTIVGPGDDCAVISIGGEQFLLAVDQLVSGIHYSPDTPPELVAAKLLKRNLSDIAAMGGIPFCALLTLATNISSDSWLQSFFSAIAGEAGRFNIGISGGDIASLPPQSPPDSLVATLTITGKMAGLKPCLRSNAIPGQILFVTGCLGNSFASNHHLEFSPRLSEGRFIANGYSSCAIDISDGLLLDASRVAAASKTGIIIDTGLLPLRPGAGIQQALSDGEDYELLFTVPEELTARLLREWPFPNPPVRIGHVCAAPPGSVTDQHGNNLLSTRNTGFRHLSG